MNKFIAIVFAAVCALSLPVLVQASGGHDLKLEHFQENLHDKESLQRGAQLFVNYCSGCHSAKYLRYERMATDLGMPVAAVQENLNFLTDKAGSQIQRAMLAEDGKTWFGNTPPDLTLETRLRSPSWVYSYLLGFYDDAKRPWGVNNHVFKDVGMPNVLESLEQELGEDDFKAAVGDLTNFMTYMSEPSRVEREGLYPWVLLWLFLMLIPVWLLNKEYWKDVH